jgi:hypothetical protein
MKRAIRIAIVSLMAIFEIVCFFDGLTTWDTPGAEYGWNISADGTTVMSVEPGRPAERAGIESGDRIDYATMPILGRLNTLQNEVVYPGAEISFTLVHRGIARTVTMKAEPFPEALAVANLLGTFGGVALALVGLALVLLRPSRMTWACSLIALPLLLPESWYFWIFKAPAAQAFASYVFISILYALQAFGMIAFASRFPNDAPEGIARLLDRLSLPFGVLAAAIYVYVDYQIFVSPVPPERWLLTLNDYGTTAVFAVLVLLALSSTYVSATRADRSRITPVILAFVLLIVASLVGQFWVQVSSSPAVYVFVGSFGALSVILVAAAIAYGVVKHRVIDVNFIVSRTLVYTILTAFVVAVFALIEYLVGKLLERGDLAQILEIAAAVAIGVSMNYLHAWLDRVIDVVLFRRRHLAEVRLEHASRTLPHVTSAASVEEMLVAEPVDALDLASAAVFRRDGTGYTREAAQGWSDGDAVQLDDNDHLVVRMRAELQPVSISDLRWPRTDIPAGIAAPLYAVPISSGHRLDAIALYGGHNGGEDLDPDERRSLRGLAGGAARAYDHIAAEDLSKTVEELRAENAALRHAQDTLVERVLKHLSQP